MRMGAVLNVIIWKEEINYILKNKKNLEKIVKRNPNTLRFEKH